MSKLTKEELEYIKHLLECREWKLDQHLQKANSFETEVLLRENKKCIGIKLKIIELWEKG